MVGSLQMVSKSIIDPSVGIRFVYLCRRCMSFWPRNLIGHNKDVTVACGCLSHITLGKEESL